MRSERYIKTTLVTLASAALGVAVALAIVPAAWADPTPLAQAEAGGAAGGAASTAVRPNPDQQTTGRTRTTSSQLSSPASLVRPNPDEQPPPAAPATIVRVTNPGGSFDWGDAAIGAVAGFALSLLGIGSITALSHRRAGTRGTALTN